jgi:small-conductance mechanosensitive channel
MVPLPAMLRVLLLVLLLLPAAGVRAQAPPAAAPAAPALTPAQAQQVLEVLRDPAKREQFISVLDDIARALPPASASASSAAPAAATAGPAAGTAAPARPAAPAPAAPGKAAAPGDLPIPLAPDSLGAEILVGASNRLSAVSDQLVVTTRTVTDFPLITRWIAHMIRSPEAREQVLDATWRLLVVMAVAVAAERLAVRLLHPGVVRLAQHAPDGAEPRAGRAGGGPPAAGLAGPSTEPPERRRRPRPPVAPALLLLRRLPFVLGRLALDMVPILLLVAVGYGLLGTPLGARNTARLVILAVLNAYALTRLVVSVMRVLLAPATPRLRVIPFTDATAAYMLRWLRRIAIIAIFGYAVTEVGLLFGLYRVAHDALLKLVALAVNLCLVIMVLQTRRRVADVIRVRREGGGVAAILRNRLAALWHVIAIFYLIALWLVSALEIEDGFAQLIRIFLATVIVGSVARVLTLTSNNALERALRVPAEVTARFPGLETRARRYHPIARGVLNGIITTVAAVVLFQAWGMDSFSWFRQGALGGQLLAALVNIGITMLVALLVWELTNAAMQRRLTRLSRGERAARVLTLMPILRTVLLIGICIVAGLIVLSDIGVNTAPLLAGAGVVGIAVGFGSQKLVQDLITGLFLLLENTMQVGDWITVSGLSGSVEQLSIRTIRLRAGDGSVHIVPFSSVTTVTNVNRGIGNASVSVSVAYGEDIDHVCKVLADIAKSMRTDPAFAPGMKTDLQLWGVDKVESGGITIVGQIVCTDAARWGVQREFNRRMQQRFGELGIRLAVPVQRLTVETVGDPAAEPPAAGDAVRKPAPAAVTAG